MKLKYSILLFFCLMLLSSGKAQQHFDQSQLKSTVITSLSVPDTRAYRYEIAALGYNSFHWQTGGTIMVELYQSSYSPSYDKYIINIGYGMGANFGEPEVSLVESYGNIHHARLMLGTPYDLSSSMGGYANKGVPIYVDVEQYVNYTVKITYLQNRVEALTWVNEIKINLTPGPQQIDNFTAQTVLDKPLSSSKNLMVSGSGNHYISNGNLGIGTTTPREKLSVNGNIRAKEIKVETANWPDYVFEEEYRLTPLPDIEAFIKTNKHLPDIPKAEVAEKEGISLGEMNKLLLKKVEELTLYLIEKDKEIRELKEMRQEINELKNKLK
ncbi:hypothetical protein ACR79T_15695 [Sphingobacterium spiritivorum]|uniref:hypothetical protein n=1 Tax=Sphingobacterium spiritivorum TaxID=258 RepID=UPI003DA5A85D